MTKELLNLEEQLLKTGAECLSLADLLGLALQSPTLARRVLKHQSMIDEINREDLTKMSKLNQSRVVRVLAVIELSKRLNTKPLRLGQPICCSQDVFDAYRARLSSKKQETFIALALNSKNCVLSEHEIHKGTLNECLVDPRNVFRTLLREGAGRTIVIHNHPSGDPTPSPQDNALCRRLIKAGHLIGIEVLDFMIVAASSCVSFRDLGMIAEVQR